MTVKPSEMFMPLSASLMSIIIVFPEGKMIMNRGKITSVHLLAPQTIL